jgi:dihydroorotate dehydrogenase (fumarate)
MSPNRRTSYLGLELPSPLVVGAAAPLTSTSARLLQLQAEGAGAVVLPSLFLEQTGPGQADVDTYLEEIRAARSALSIPVIASLNGNQPGQWLQASTALAQAGAHALELNLYTVPTDAERSSADLEAEQVAVVREVCASVTIPVAVKLSPWYTALAPLARELQAAGARALVLFNRFYQPNVDIETLQTVSRLELSGPGDQRLPLRWIGLLHGRLELELAASGGIANGGDAVRLLMVGAQVTQVVSALLRGGPGKLQRMNEELELWLAEHGIQNLDGLRGCLSQRRSPDPEAFERAQYVRTLSQYSPPQSWSSLR